MMRKKVAFSFITFFVIASIAFGHGKSMGHTVYCVNCSDKFTQALERVTNIQQLSTLMNQYSEDITQTAQQIRMVQQNIEMIAGMVQNTKNLSPETLLRLKDRFVMMGRQINDLNRYTGEAEVLDEVFRETYPSLEEVEGMVDKDVSVMNEEYQRRYRQWAQEKDDATRATFKLSGEQLAEIADSEEFDDHVQELLSTPEGRMEALQAANQLNAIQIQEARALRALLAMNIQRKTQSDAKEEKEDQAVKAWWKKATTAPEGLYNIDPNAWPTSY